MKKIINEKTANYRKQKKFHVPIIGYTNNESIRYNSIIEAEELTGICYHLIFDACIGRTRSAGLMKWEFENGRHWIKYHAKRVLGQRALRPIGFNG